MSNPVVPVWIEAETARRPQLEEAVRRGGGAVAPLDQAQAIVWVADRPLELQALLHPGVRWVQLSSAGIEDWLVAGVVDDERDWTAATGVYARPIAEYVIGMLLAAARRLPDVIRSSSWQPREVRALGEATVGVIGAGGIGSAVIDRLQPFGARTLALTRTGKAVPGADLSVGPDALDMVLEESDFLVLAVPETLETRSLLDASRLARMRPDAWLVNVGRGSAVDTGALVAELLRGRLGGAVLDVTDPEPLPDEHPLWALPNVIITSHTASTRLLGAGALAGRVQENVSRFGRGETLLGLIELQRGY